MLHLLAHAVGYVSEETTQLVNAKHACPLTLLIGAPFPPPLFHDPSERLRIFAQWRLNFEPGSQFTYHPSSSMYVVGDIIERRSGMTYGDFVRQRVALPLGL
ncbi:MAG: serine hydrolase, partial [bacterium]